MRIRYRGVLWEIDDELWGLLLGPKPPDGFRCNGCGAGGAALAAGVPDSFLDVPLWIGCSVHDFHYSKDAPLGGTWESRQLADWLLGINVELLLRSGDVNPITARAVSYAYRGRVRMWGSKAFRGWAPGEKPEGLWQRMQDAYGLFIPRDPRAAELREQYEGKLEYLRTQADRRLMPKGRSVGALAWPVGEDA